MGGLRAPTIANGIRTISERTSFRSIGELVDFGRVTCSGLIRPMQERGEIADLLELVRERDCHRIVELGTARGGTLFYFCRVASPDATIVTVDRDCSCSPGDDGLSHDDLFRAFALPGQTVRAVNGPFHQDETFARVRDAVADVPVDFLFIDGDHSYTGVKADFERYSTLVRPGGLIALHDIVPSHKDGVEPFWREIKDRYRTSEFIHRPEKSWGGIGVIFVD